MSYKRIFQVFENEQQASEIARRLLARGYLAIREGNAVYLASLDAAKPMGV